MAKVLLSLPWDDASLDGEIISEAMEKRAVTLLDEIVSATVRAGAKKQHYSWASKILHWQFPGQIPIYDSFVRKFLGISEEKKQAYREIVRWEYEVARELLPSREQAVGLSQPRFLFRAIDKYLWWKGGGEESKAAPWTEQT